MSRPWRSQMVLKPVTKRSYVLTKEAPGRYDAGECPGATVSLVFSQRKRADEGTVRWRTTWPRGSGSAGFPGPGVGGDATADAAFSSVLPAKSLSAGSVGSLL